MNPYWLYLHPYVHSAIKKERAVIYNTLNGKILEYKENKKIVRLINRLNSDSNLYVIKLKEEEIDASLSQFIKDIRKFYMGDLIDTIHSPNKPIQLKPMLNLQKTFDYLTTYGNKSKILINDELGEYLNVVTLYINDRCDLSCPMCSTAYKQFLCCFKTDIGRKEIAINHISQLINEIKNINLYKFNILGGNIFLYSKLFELIPLLNSINVIKEFYVHYLHLDDGREYSELFSDENNHLSIFIHFPLKMEEFNQRMSLLNHYDIGKRIHFLIEKDEDMAKAERVISDYQIEDYILTPYYNGNNLKFFKENVFLNRDSIIESKPTMNDIFARMTINTSDFKKLTILSNGDVYANLNNPKIGKLGKDYLFDLMYKELNEGKSWTKVRKHVSPCKGCVYNALCPPISNYEYIIGRYNLCDML